MAAQCRPPNLVAASAKPNSNLRAAQSPTRQRVQTLPGHFYCIYRGVGYNGYMAEVYKPIKGYEGLYEVSNLGNIKSLDKVRGKQKYPERIMKKERVGKGYDRVMLSRFGKTKKIYVHRIVAGAFLERSKGKKQINHINGIKHDNRATNIEWVTGSENMRHFYSLKRGF